MERNLLAREIQNLDYFYVGILPLGAFGKASGIYQIPSKLDEETTDGYTCYVAIDLGITNKGYRCYYYDKAAKKYKVSVCYTEAPPDKMTAIYIPDHFKAASEIEMIIYLHGYVDGHPGMIPAKTKGKVNSPSIQYYLNYSKEQYFNFRKIINTSGKNVVFVAPTLGATSQYGSLATNFDNYIDQVISAINEYIFKKRNLEGQFSLGKLIIAAHSGGGTAMLDIAEQSKSTYAKRIKSFWGFDSWYNKRCAKYENKECKAYKSPWNDIAKNKSFSIYAYHYNSGYYPKGDNKTVFVTNAGADTNLKNLTKKGESIHFTLLPYYFEKSLSTL